MDADGFLPFVAEHRWRTAKSSPHQYTIKFWSRDKEWFAAAVRHADEQGEEGYWNKEKFFYYRPGDGYRYWSYRKRGEGCKAEDVVAFNRAWESGQERLPLTEEERDKAERLTWSDGDVSIKRE